jgi:Rnl2 family RNA ligase
MKFKKYSSIENAYRQKVVDNLMTYNPKGPYVVQEKIHGANFAIYVDESGVKYAKRSGFIDNPASFYRADIIAEKYGEKAQKLFDYVQNPLSDEEVTLSIHGEIYGGSYPHKDVEAIKGGAKKVQSGVFYCPEVEFIAFDLKLNGDYISIETMNTLLDEFNIPRLKVLKEGTLKECLEYPNEFNSNLHGLPELEDNTCEGVVIKSIDPDRMPNGDRYILKNKNAKWSEKGKKGPVTVKELPAHVIPFVETAVSYINENRLRNVLSKIGPITNAKAAFSTVISPLNQDVIEDFMKENPEFAELDKSDRGIVTKQINKAAANLIRENLYDILDGEF